MNLLEETIKDLADNNKTTQDVKWCGSTNYGSFSWGTFEKLANIEYDDGYGGQEIAKDLIIVGNNWWLERHEYDGSECWEFKEMPQKPAAKTPVTLCSDDHWATIEEMNRPGGKYGL